MKPVTKLFDAPEIERRVDELAVQIAETLPREFMVVGILKGCFVFLADLIRALGRAGCMPSIEFVRLSSYGQSRQSSGQIQVIDEIPAAVAGRNILLVDDISDTGRSLAYARTLLLEEGSARVWTCALVDKPCRREVDISPNFVGFTVDDVFIVGYGIDFAENYRHLPYIGALK